MHIVEQIAVQLGLDAKSYNSEADRATKTSDRLEGKLGDVEKQSASLDKSFAGMSKAIAGATKILSGLFSAIAVGSGLSKLISDVQKVNNELFFLEKNLGMSTRSIKAWQGAAAAGGGSAEGMTSSMKGLNKSMNDFVVRGDTTLLPFMNALGVSMTDNKGKLKDTDAMMLDLADSFSKMDREQAFSIGQDMGFDEGTLNVLLQGRDALKESLEYQKQMYVSSEKELEASRELSKNTAQLQAHWESMKLMMGNAIIPLLVKLTAVAKIFFEFLQRHQETVKNVFEAMGFIIGTILIPILGKALIAALAFIAPFAPFILVVTALSAAFIALYDDYKTWAEGGNSLFNWGAFRDYIDNATLSTDNLKNAFKNLTKDMMSGVIPTLKGYADIVKMLASGDFKGAGKLAFEMTKEYYKNVAGVIDDITGQEKGTLANAATNLFSSSGGSASSGASSSGDFSSALSLAAKKFGITDKKELAAFNAIVGHESADGKKLSEDARYSFKGWQRIAPDQRNVRNWLKTHNEADFKKLSNEDKLNIMYEGMNGNRRGEGYKFRGRGGIQLTGRANYQAFANASGRQDIMDNPDLVATDKNLAAQASAWFWSNNKNIGKAARAGDIQKARRLVNGGDIGMSDVVKRYNNLSNQASMAQAQISNGNASLGNTQSSSRTNNVDVKVGDIKVYTTASTISGTSADAMSSVSAQINQLVGSMT